MGKNQFLFEFEFILKKKEEKKIQDKKNFRKIRKMK